MNKGQAWISPKQHAIWLTACKGPHYHHILIYRYLLISCSACSVSDPWKGTRDVALAVIECIKKKIIPKEENCTCATACSHLWMVIKACAYIL